MRLMSMEKENNVITQLNIKNTHKQNGPIQNKLIKYKIFILNLLIVI
jgi:hypothetical protein